MAGLVAAARARELGLRPRVIEKGTRVGGSMLLSSCVVWRHRDWEDFRTECPGGDRALQRLIWERLDDAIAWLQARGAIAAWDETGNPRTVGKRFDPRQLVDVLLRDVEPELGAPLEASDEPPVVLACGGFGKRLAAEHGLLLRANPWSDGAAVDFALERGGALTDGQNEFYGRAMPAPPARVEEQDFVGASQLYGRFARVYDEDGVEFFEGPVSWSENDLVQAIARRPGGRAWYLLDDAALRQRIRERSVGQLVDEARRVGGTVLDPRDLTFGVDADARVAVHVAAAVTHTIGGLRVDPQARVLDVAGTPVDGLYAAGVDAGGVATGGYASGLAQALVLGLAAAESVATG
jgi:succinate dehydrogenase/fumarate reductase flavoprotein subunit